MGEDYFPRRGHVVWVDLDPVKGHEQGGRRPAFVLSHDDYNRIGLMIVCPITTKPKGYPFEVLIPHGCRVKGVILADHIKNLDWRRRDIQHMDSLPDDVIREVQQKLGPLIF
jgi:mRNA interferase MazF